MLRVSFIYYDDAAVSSPVLLSRQKTAYFFLTDVIDFRTFVTFFPLLVISFFSSGGDSDGGDGGVLSPSSCTRGCWWCIQVVMWWWWWSWSPGVGDGGWWWCRSSFLSCFSHASPPPIFPFVVIFPLFIPHLIIGLSFTRVHVTLHSSKTDIREIENGLWGADSLGSVEGKGSSGRGSEREREGEGGLINCSLGDA